jgi:multisubunit Na+/H+ antiporter MnhG subunit
LYTEFIDWAKFLILGLGGILLAVLMWQGEGWAGKAIVIIVGIFIFTNAITRTHSKFINYKTNKDIEEQVVRRIDKIHDNLGETAIRFQKYLDESKKGDDK